MSHSGFGGGRRGQYPLKQPVFPELPPSEDPMPAYATVNEDTWFQGEPKHMDNKRFGGDGKRKPKRKNRF